MNIKKRIALLVLIAMCSSLMALCCAVGLHIGRAIAHIEIAEAAEIVSEPTPIPETKPALPVIQTEGRTLAPELVETMAIMCQNYDVPLALVLAVAEQESRFNPDAVSGTSDFGLMQINRVNHGWLRQCGIDPLTHRGNIEAGCLMLSNVVKKYADYNLALMAYNCGEGGANRLWKQGIYSTAYSRSVMARYAKWSAYLGGN